MVSKMALADARKVFDIIQIHNAGYSILYGKIFLQHCKFPGFACLLYHL